MNEPVIQPVTTTSMVPEARKLLMQLGGSLEASSNFVRTLCHSPAALASLATQLDVAANMRLSPRTQEAIALRVAELNGSDYCVAAHTAASKQLGVDAASAGDYRRGLSDDPREQALLALTTKVVLDRGHHCGFAVAAARKVGVTDAEIVEVIALIGLNTMSTYVNSIANTTVDYPAPAGLDMEERE